MDEGADEVKREQDSLLEPHGTERVAVRRRSRQLRCPSSLDFERVVNDFSIQGKRSHCLTWLAYSIYRYNIW